jgi:hypothetical protein
MVQALSVPDFGRLMPENGKGPNTWRTRNTWRHGGIARIDCCGFVCILPRRIFWGRTGFDLGNAPEAACRGWFVGLVNHSDQNINANEELALAA